MGLYLTHGDHEVGDGLWMSPVREELVTAGGHVFSTDGDSRDTDLLYRSSVSTGPLRLLDLAWETTLDKWAAIDTDLVRVHDLSSHQELERFMLPGTGRSVGFHAGLVFALQVDGDESRIDVFVPDNRPPLATLAAPSSAECDGPSGAEILLDAAGSGDPDSIPGLFEDVVSLRWFRAEASGGWLELGSGQRLAAVLPLGSNLVELRVTDHAGVTSSAQAQVEVVDTTPPVLTITAQPPALPASGRLVYRAARRVAARRVRRRRPGHAGRGDEQRD